MSVYDSLQLLSPVLVELFWLICLYCNVTRDLHMCTEMNMQIFQRPDRGDSLMGGEGDVTYFLER